ncbi:hypothetical protein WJX73_000696 [Symbiochloris irregularis]|uniref:Uncharacterized protein n=1 Tax=Symbiochloris irregularis TaxID=706552 RepID=A0AAW1NKJ4_9CHLO
MADQNSALTANSSQLSTSPFAAQAKSPLDDDVDEDTSGVRFAPKHQIHHGNSQSTLASSFNASTSGPVTERPSAAAQKVDDRTRAAANEALEHLMEGNKRFLQGKFERCIPDLELLEEGLGDLLCIRVAGNVVNDFVLGSVLFAVSQLGLRLVLVLSHTHCTVVANAVHRWASKRAAAVLDDNAVQALATNLQKASDPSQAGQEATAADVSPDPAAATKAKGSHSKIGLLSRVFGNKPSATTASHPADVKKGETRASSGHRASMSRESGDVGSSGMYERASMNPVERIVAAVSTAVDAVASEGKALHNFALKPEDAEDEQGSDLQSGAVIRSHTSQAVAADLREAVSAREVYLKRAAQSAQHRQVQLWPVPFTQLDESRLGWFSWQNREPDNFTWLPVADTIVFFQAKESAQSLPLGEIGHQLAAAFDPSAVARMGAAILETTAGAPLLPDGRIACAAEIASCCKRGDDLHEWAPGQEALVLRLSSRPRGRG